MNKKIVSNGIIVLLIFSIPTILYLLNFKSILFDTSFYAAEFEKHEVYEKFEGADEINERLLNYFRDDKELVDIDLYIDEASEDTLIEIMSDGSLKELMRYAIKKSSLAHMGFVVDIKESIIDHSIEIESVVEDIHNENMQIEK